MIKAVIVDDEQPAIDMLQRLLEQTGRVEVVGTCRRPSQAVQEIQRLQPDAAFLDIEMPGISGLELAESLLDQAVGSEVVFVTAFRQYALEAFECNAVDYLLKPASQARVDKAVDKLLLQCAAKALDRPEPGKSSIRCFGSFELRKTAAASPLKWRTAKVEELLAFLLYHRGTIVQKGRIIETLWPDADGETGDSYLHTTVYRLKKTLKENRLDLSVKFSGGGYILTVGAMVEHDVEGFESFIVQSGKVSPENVAAFERTVRLYQGEYLAGKDYDWCLSERTRLERYYSDLVKQLARYYLEVGAHQQAETALLANIATLPYDEEAYEMLLRVCFLQGKRLAIRQLYAQLSDMLQAELGVEPRPSLKRLYEQCMDNCQ